METTSDAEPFDMRDFKVALHATHVRETGKVVAHVAVSSPVNRHEGLVIEDITPDVEYIDGNVLVLRFDFAGTESPWTRLSRSRVIDDGAALEYVALMYGPKAGPWKLAAVKIIEGG